MTERRLRLLTVRLRLRGGRVELAVGLALLAGFAALGLWPVLFDVAPPEKMDLLARLAPPSALHPLGTDHLGRDVMSRLMGAVPVSLGAAFATMAAILAVALPWGIIAAVAGGRVDMVMMRLTDIIMAFPTLVLALAVIGFMGASLQASIIGIAAAWWPSNARLVRALVLSASKRDFARAAYLCGASRLRVVLRHILPQVLPPLAIIISLETASVLLALSSLSFLGIGAQPPTPEWGVMLNEARPFFAQAPHMLIAPGLAVTVAVLALNLIGEGLKDLLDKEGALQMVAALHVQNLTVGVPNEAPLLDGLSFALAPGERIGLVGASGSGKSVTAAALCGLLRAPLCVTGGSVRIDGREILGASAADLRQMRGREIFQIFQSPSTALTPVRRIRAQLSEAAQVAGVDIKTALPRALDAVKLPSHVADFFPYQLSGGMKQRVLIAMALILRPRILIADEPTTGLDILTEGDILCALNTMADDAGASVLFISHDLRAVRKVATRTLVLHEGRLVENNLIDGLALSQASAARELAAAAIALQDPC